MKVGFTTLALATIFACSPDGRTRGPDDQPPDAPTVTPDLAPAVCYASMTEVDVALTVQIEESCAIWNSLELLSGTAFVSRANDTITIDFGDGVVFTGPLVGNMVTLVYTHDHPFTDGCGWRATETMQGTLDPDGCAFALTYDYVESVVQNNGGCASPCSANADVSLELDPIIL